MMPGGPIDLGVFDGRVARAHQAAVRARARFGDEGGREEARIADPFEGLRDVAGQSTLHALRALEPSLAEVPHRDALVRWVYELLQTRIAWELLVDEADAEHAQDPSLSPRAAREALRAAVESPLASAEAQAATAGTFDAARRALVLAPHVAVVELALGRLTELAAPVAAVRKELRARRFEAARRLGLDHPWALAADVSNLEALARAVLDATEPLATELRRELRRRTGTSAGPALTIDEAFARDAREGWPAHLAPRWLEELFRAVAPRAPRAVHLPPALGGASFLRAAAAWGAALRGAGVPRTFPFALARDPYPTEAFAFGGAFAIAVADPVFARRKLGLSAREASAHARALARVLFHELRAEAVAVIAGLRESMSGEVEELSARIFGAPLPPALASAWSYGGFSGASRVDAPARLVGAVRAHALVRSLVERFDEDWFDNPRAGAHLAAIAAGPIGSGEVPDAAAVGPIARALEEALG